jgi:hypothetical protein
MLFLPLHVSNSQSKPRFNSCSSTFWSDHQSPNLIQQRNKTWTGLDIWIFLRNHQSLGLARSWNTSSFSLFCLNTAKILVSCKSWISQKTVWWLLNNHIHVVKGESIINQWSLDLKILSAGIYHLQADRQLIATRWFSLLASTNFKREMYDKQLIARL